MVQHWTTKAIKQSVGVMAKPRLGVTLALALLISGCTSQEKEEVPQSAPEPAAGAGIAVEPSLELARVGDASITAGQLQAFYAKMPDYLQSKKEGLEKERRHLQTLIDMELLQLEAVARGVHRLPVFTNKMEQYRREKLVGLYTIKKIKVRVTDPEISAYYQDQELSRQVRFAQIIAGSQDSIGAALEEIAQGQSFADVARKWSIHEQTASRGGDLGKYEDKLDMPPQLRQPLFALATGEVSQPIHLGNNWALFKNLDEIEGQLDEEAYQKIYRSLFIERSVRERTALVDSLKAALGLEMNRPGLEAFSAAMGRGVAPSEETGALILCRFEGGQITAGDLLSAVSQLKYMSIDLRSAEEVADYIESDLAPDALFIAAALSEGLDRDQEVEAWLAKKEKQELVVQLRVLVLDERVHISEEEVRREYEEHPARYARPDQVEIQEILVDTEAEALALLERVRQGEAMGPLARQYSKRPAKLHDGEGRRRFSAAAGPLYGRLVPTAAKTPVGELGGPLQVPGGFTIFKVLSRQEVPSTFSGAKKRARARVNWVKKHQVFDEFIGELRTKYAPQVTIREDNLKLAFAGD